MSYQPNIDVAVAKWVLFTVFDIVLTSILSGFVVRYIGFIKANVLTVKPVKLKLTIKYSESCIFDSDKCH